jgi:phage tail tape-measure protein
LANVRIKYTVDKSQVDAAEKSLEELNRTTDISQKEADELNKKFKNLDSGKVKSGVKDVNGELGKFNNLAVKGTQLLAGFFAVSQLTQMAKDAIRVTGEFQKFQAVLTNTLGSGSKAKKALDDITKFASVTPFSVQQLTASFVKLANQGFVPTTNELRNAY